MKRMNLILGRKNSEKQTPDPSNSIESKCQKVCDDVADTFITLANEPSLAYFRIQEHVRKSTPSLLDERNKILKIHNELQGRCFDLDYSIGAIDSASRATSHLVRLNELLKSSLFTKLQLDYAQKQSSNFELGIDAAAIFVGDDDEVPVASSSSSSKTRRSQRKERVPSIGTEATEINLFSSPSETSVHSSLSSSSSKPEEARSVTSPKLSNITSTMSTAAVEVRQRAINLTRRALFTRSADVSGTDLTEGRSAPSTNNLTMSVDSSESRVTQPSCESALDTSQTGK